MDPNAPTWSPYGSSNQNNYQQQQNQYNPQYQQGQQQYGYPQQTMQQQQPQQQYYGQMNTQQQYQQGNYSQSYNQQQNQNYNYQSQQRYNQQNYQSQGYSGQQYSNSQGYNGQGQNYGNSNTNYNRNYGNNTNNYNKSNYSNNNYDNTNRNSNYNNSGNEYNRNAYPNQNQNQNQNYNRNFNNQNRQNNNIQQTQNQFQNMNLNNQPQGQSQQQQQQSQQQNVNQQQQQQQQQPQSTQAATSKPATNDFNDDSDDGQATAQQQQKQPADQSGGAAGGAGGGGKKKKRRKKKKGGGGGGAAAAKADDAPAQAQAEPQAQAQQQVSQPSQPTPQTSQDTQPTPTSKEVIDVNKDIAASQNATETSNTQETSDIVSDANETSVPSSEKPKVESSSATPKASKKNENKKSDNNNSKTKQTPKAKNNENESKTQESSKPAKGKKSKKKSKANVDVHDEREHLNLVLIGHVDAGKSTISGQILLQTGQIDERVIAKYKKEAKESNRESWWIAYIMDQDDEERAKGKTVECGRAHFETPSKRYTILDAPGHKNYVPNMISGANQADVALLVISARRGEFDAGFNRGGQTREHAVLAYTLGITRVVIVINKMDTCKWSQERYSDIETKVKQFLTQVGFKSKYIDCVPVSGQSGMNISPKNPLTKEVCPWWGENGKDKNKNKTLLDTLDGLKKLKRSGGGALRIPILDRYKGDKGIQAIGKIESGHVSVGDSIIVMPTNTSCKVAALAIDDVSVDNAVAGENVLISFESQKSQLSMDNIFGGCVLCSTDNVAPKVSIFRAMIALQAELPNNGIITKGYTAMFHCHNVTAKCEIFEMKHLLNKKDGRKSRLPPKFLRANQSAIVDVRIEGGAVAVEEYSNFQQLGRFTLRDQGQTVAIGRIEEILGLNDDEQKTRG